MTTPLSQDLGWRIVRAVEKGRSTRQAAARYEVSPSAAIKLMRRFRETGSVMPERIGGRRHTEMDVSDRLCSGIRDVATPSWPTPTAPISTSCWTRAAFWP
jgi:putative transposase